MISYKALTREESIRLLSEDDSYLAALNSPNYFWKKSASTNESYLNKILIPSLVDPSRQRIVELRKDFLRFNEKLKELAINIDLEVNIASCNNHDNFNLPYTRKDIIVLPVKQEMGTNIYQQLVHETFHVLSRKNPQITESFAKELGFSKETIEWKHFDRVINPDDPSLDYYLFHEGKKIYPMFEKGIWTNLKPRYLIDGKVEKHHNIKIKKLPLLLQEKSHHLPEISSPEEIAAEHFRKLMNFTTYALSKEEKVAQLLYYRNEIKQLLKIGE